MFGKTKRIALRSLIAGAALVGLLAAASPALASTASATKVGVAYTAAPGEANNVTISPSNLILGCSFFCIPPVAIDITDSGASITPVRPFLNEWACDFNSLRPGAVSCALVFGGSIAVALGDLDDRFSMMSAASGTSVDGGTGNDQLFGGPLGDVLLGSGGDDTLVGGAGPDVLDGGAGTDSVDYSARSAPVSVTLDGIANDGGAGESDVLLNVENVIGGNGHDVFFGSDGANFLSGLGGNDLIRGRGGNDNIWGSAGDDQLKGGAGFDRLRGWTGDDDIVSSDGEYDYVDCGPGYDEVISDPFDLVMNCEIEVPEFEWDVPWL